MDKIQALLEGEKRGILNPQNAALLAEARKRGLVPSEQINTSDMTPAALERSNTKAATEAVGLLPDQGEGRALLDQMIAGAGSNFADEMSGVFGAGENLIGMGRPGETMTNAYKRARDLTRKILASEQAFHPAASNVGNVVGQVGAGVGAGMASGVRGLLALMGLGGAEGAASNVGASESSDPVELAQTGAVGFGLGAAGAGAGGYLPAVAGKFTPKGLAYDAIMAGTDKGEMLPAILAKMRANGTSAAEADPVLRDVLHGQAQKNSSAAIRALSSARTRLAGVNADVQESVNRMISPDNAQLLLKKLKDDAQTFAKANYGIAHTSEGRVGLVPDLANNPGMQPAVEAAKQLAEMEGRTFDVTSLGVKDLDAMQRALKGETEQLFKEGGTKTIFGPVKSEMREDVNSLAKSMSQEFADVQARYAQNIKQREAVKLGATALSPSKEATEIAAEYAALSASEQEAYRAAVATKARTLLAAKRPNANVSAALSPEGILEKLKAVGFPDDQLQALIEKGTAARGVVDALQGGSDTARNLAAGKASESVMSNIKPTTILTGVIGNPAFIPILEAFRRAGQTQERGAAERIIKALIAGNPDYLNSITRTAPQAFERPGALVGGPLLNNSMQNR